MMKKGKTFKLSALTLLLLLITPSISTATQSPRIIHDKASKNVVISEDVFVKIMQTAKFFEDKANLLERQLAEERELHDVAVKNLLQKYEILMSEYEAEILRLNTELKNEKKKNQTTISAILGLTAVVLIATLTN